MTTRSALFVDFDNVFAGLGGNGSAAAVLFAEEPGRWVDWLSAGGDRPRGQRRRFLVKVCYLSESYSGHRRAFVDSGFRVVDCPTLTGAGKNGADIHLVIDALDALASTTRYDEFVLASADAEFAPLLHRLRAHDRRTTVLRGGRAAPALASLCDSHISRDQFATALLDPGPVAPAGVAAHSAVPSQRSEAEDVARIAAEAVRALVRTSSGSVLGGVAAQAARRACPQIEQDGWPGARTFAGFVELHLPELRWTGTPVPGRLASA